jgi:hypothetical protein
MQTLVSKMCSFGSMMWKENPTSYNTDYTKTTHILHVFATGNLGYMRSIFVTCITPLVIFTLARWWLVVPGSLYLLRDEARGREFGEGGESRQDSGTTELEAGDELICLSVAAVDARPLPDPVRAADGGSTWVGYTSLTSSMPSSTYMTSCIVSWWYSTISRRNLFSRAYTEFSCASRAFSANSVSNCRRICKEAEYIHG